MSKSWRCTAHHLASSHRCLRLNLASRLYRLIPGGIIRSHTGSLMPAFCDCVFSLSVQSNGGKEMWTARGGGGGGLFAVRLNETRWRIFYTRMRQDVCATATLNLGGVLVSMIVNAFLLTSARLGLPPDSRSTSRKINSWGTNKNLAEVWNIWLFG